MAMAKEESKEPTFKEELTNLINKHGWDNRIGMPDFVIANYLNMSLSALHRVSLETK